MASLFIRIDLKRLLNEMLEDCIISREFVNKGRNSIKITNFTTCATMHALRLGTSPEIEHISCIWTNL